MQPNNIASSGIYRVLVSLILLIGSSTFLSAQPILLETFENLQSFTNRWTVESLYQEDVDPPNWGVVDDAFGSVKSHSGTNKLYCAGIGYLGTSPAPFYPDNTATIMSATVDLTNGSSATLTFWYYHKIFLGDDEYFPEVDVDYMTVYVDDEAIWDTTFLETFTSTWRFETLDLTQFIGGKRTIRFEFFSDSSSQLYPFTRGKGIFLDDIAVTEQPVPKITTISQRASIGVPAALQLRASGGTGNFTWSRISGALPPGLTLSAAGLLSGTPTTLGSYNINVRVSDLTGVSTNTLVNVNIVAPLKFAQIQMHSGVHASFLVSGPVGTNYLLQHSPDLVGWTTLTNFNLSGSSVSFVDQSSSGVSNRYYRVVAP